MRRLLVLRPQPGGNKTVARAREKGLDAVAVPLFEIEALPWEAPDPSCFDGLLLTSANSVRLGGEQLQRLRNLPVYAVGDATARAAREAALSVVAIGDSGVERLLSSIDRGLRLLHLCGEDRRQPTNANQRVTQIAGHRARAVEAPDLSKAGGSVALIHSPRAGRRFAELVSDRGSIAIVAISRAAAEAVGSGWQTVHAAEQPRDDALLALAARVCNNSLPK
jgi:uroporphyrinogen-III synthase